MATLMTSESKMELLKTPGFFEDWIDGCNVFSRPLEFPAEPSFPRAFYERCLSVFASMARSGPIQRSKVLKTALGRLALWAEGFPDNKLDRVLGNAPQLKNAVLELLVPLGDNLIKSQ